jgi:hypothetical protein
MPFTSLSHYERRSINSILLNQYSSNPPPSYQEATTLPSYKESNKHYIHRQQPDIFSQQYRTCEQLVYSFIKTGECPKCLHLESTNAAIKNRTCKHVINAVCYIKTNTSLQLFCKKISIYYDNGTYHTPFDEVKMPLSKKFKIIQKLPQLQPHEVCAYNAQTDSWNVSQIPCHGYI